MHEFSEYDTIFLQLLRRLPIGHYSRIKNWGEGKVKMVVSTSRQGGSLDHWLCNSHISKLFKKGYFRSRNRRKISQTQMTRGKGVDFVKFGGNLSIEISIRWSICNPIQHPLMSCLHDYLVQNFALQPSWFNSWPAIQENIRHHLSLYEYAWCLSFQTWNPLVRAL